MNYDVIVIGGNFAGLTAALQLVRARRQVLLIDAGQPRNRFAHASHGFLGQDGRTPAEIQQTGLEQLRAYPTFAFIQGEATSARQEQSGFSVTLTDSQTHHAARLILATGVRDELPAIPGLRERWGQTVVHCPYCHGYELGAVNLGVLASHPHSAQQAVLVSDWGPTTFFTQGAFEPDPELLPLFATHNIQIERSPIVELLGPAPTLERVKLANGTIMPIGGLFVAPIVHMASPLAEQLGCEFEEGPLGKRIDVGDNYQTSIPGVFAAGDAMLKMHSATLAATSGVMAAINAHRSLLGFA